MRLLKYILFIVSLYIYLYNPIFRILGFGSIKLLLLISILFVFINGQLPLFIRTFNNEIKFTLILITYSLFTFIWGDYIWGDISGVLSAYTYLIWFLEGFVIPIFILTFFKDLFQTYSWESLIVSVGTIASIITLYLIFNPNINTWVRDSIIFDSLDSFGTTWTIRGFSIAESSSYFYSIVQAIVLAICLFSLKKSILYAIPIIPLLISIFFNARIGLSVVLISLMLMIIFNKVNTKVSIVMTVLVLFGLYLYNNSLFVVDNLKSINWGLSFFSDSSSLLNSGINNKSNGTYNTLFNNMLFIPNNILGLLFGEGHSVYGIKGRSSDIGYVNQIFLGGIFYLFIMFLFLRYMYSRNIKYATDRLYAILFIISILVVNIKGNAFFHSSGFFRLFTLYYVYCIYKASGKFERQTKIMNSHYQIKNNPSDG